MLSLSIDPTFWPGYYLPDETKPTGQRWVPTESKIDGESVPSQRQALDYCRKRRVVGEFVKALFKAGCLRSSRYFAVVEVQDETLMVHWHLLVEADFVPMELSRLLWDRNRPKWVGPKPADRPGFGTVRYTTSKKIFSPGHAINYATKYIIKPPPGGWPEWILDLGRFHRYSVSHRFWLHGDAWEPDQSPGTDGFDWETGKAPDRRSVVTERKPQVQRTIRERLASCKSKCVLVQVRDHCNIAGETVRRQQRMVAMFDFPVKGIAHELGADDWEEDIFYLTDDQVADVMPCASFKRFLEPDDEWDEKIDSVMEEKF
jgi:hypothetical protein